jgi:hypothetical protein
MTTKSSNQIIICAIHTTCCCVTNFAADRAMLNPPKPILQCDLFLFLTATFAAAIEQQAPDHAFGVARPAAGWRRPGGCLHAQSSRIQRPQLRTKRESPLLLFLSRP